MYEVGKKVKYRSLRSGVVLGRVVKGVRYVPNFGDAVDVAVTSRKNPHYPHGYIYTFRVDTPWLSERD